MYFPELTHQKAYSFPVKYRKWLLSFLFLWSVVSSIHAQEADEIIKWEFSSNKKNSSTQDIVDLVFTGTLQKGWILYSSDFTADIGPQPTVFTFTDSANISLIGTIIPQTALRKKDKTWGTELRYFTDKAIFRAKVLLRKTGSPVKGIITGQLCSNKEGICIPFQKIFEL